MSSVSIGYEQNMLSPRYNKLGTECFERAICYLPWRATCPVVGRSGRITRLVQSGPAGHPRRSHPPSRRQFQAGGPTIPAKNSQPTSQNVAWTKWPCRLPSASVTVTDAPAFHGNPGYHDGEEKANTVIR